MNVIAEIQRINETELQKGLVHTPASWHTKYKDSAWIHVGNMPIQLTEGDVICAMSQYGEIEDINLVRDKDSGKSRGFAFIKYEDARSCVLAVDNLNGSQLLGRSLRVDHVEKYRLPKHLQEKEDDDKEKAKSSARGIAEVGHAYEGKELASSFNIQSGQDLFAAPKEDTIVRHVADMGPAKTDEETKEERRRRKEARAQKRREKEEHRQRKEQRKRRRKG